MKLYKSPTGEIWAYELDGSQDHLIPSDFVALTQDEINAREAEFQEKKLQREEYLKNKEDAKASALAKLTSLGLTEDEVKALLG